jgi:hypothetical protein
MQKKHLKDLLELFFSRCDLVYSNRNTYKPDPDRVDGWCVLIEEIDLYALRDFVNTFQNYEKFSLYPPTFYDLKNQIYLYKKDQLLVK